jgi:Anti-sigma-K factor rskA/Putative zinc-finger
MERLTEHGQFQELLGAYSLDAVELEERDDIERHLAVCPRCRAEVAEHREVAGLLGYAGSDAPPGLWDRIVASLEEPPPALQLTRMLTDQPATGSEQEGRGATAGAGGRATAAVVPIDKGRRTIGVRAFAALAAVAALAAAVLGVEVVRLNKRTNDLNNSIGAEAIQGAYRAATSNPGARRVILRSGDGSRLTAAVIMPDGTAYLDPRNLPSLPTNETYQLWGVIGSDKISLAVIGNTPRLVEFGAPNNVAALAVTAERAGGVVVTQQQPIVVGTVPSSPQPSTTIRNAGNFTTG